MSGPNPPGREPDEPESEPVSDTGDERASGNHLPPVAGGGDKLPSDQTGETDAYSRAYSAPESEHVTGGPYVPADLRLYDYDDYEESSDLDDEGDDDGHRDPDYDDRDAQGQPPAPPVDLGR